MHACRLSSDNQTIRVGKHRIIERIVGMLLLLPLAASLRVRPALMMAEPTKASVVPDTTDAAYPSVDVTQAAEIAKALRDTGVPTTERLFARSGDLLSMGEKVTAREVVSVLGRWQTLADWNTIGVLGEMDQLFNEATGEVQDGPALRRAWERWDESNLASLWGATVKKDRTAELPPWKARSPRAIRACTRSGPTNSTSTW